MSLVLNLLLQNELEPKKMEGHNCDKFIKLKHLMVMELLDLKIELSRIRNVMGTLLSQEYDEGMQLCWEIKNMTRETENETLSVMGCWARLHKTFVR